MKRMVIMALGIMALSGCSTTPVRSPETPAAMTPVPVRPAPAIPAPSAQSLPQSASPNAPVATLKPMADDQCGAQALQYLVGKPRTDIPVPLDPSSRRVVCSTCVTTQEFRADRQTITFSSDTGLITSVKCN